MFPFSLETKKTKRDVFRKLKIDCHSKEFGRMGAKKYFQFKKVLETKSLWRSMLDACLWEILV